MAYLVMMAIRLAELHRVLKPTGSIYLHCDTTASHYLKLLMDSIFGLANHVNEICWKRTSAKSDYRQGATHWPRVHDIIFLYRKDQSRTPIFQQLLVPYDATYISAKYPYVDGDGRRYGLWDMTGPGGAAKGNPRYEVLGITRYWRYSEERMQRLLAEGRVIQPRLGAVPRLKRYLDEMPGIAIGDMWDDISPINSQAKERLGYPTQKPQALLERIIGASSNEGDSILDPFCGCGTTINVAERLHRKWIGIDITHLAIALIKNRLHDTFGPELSPYEVIGDPKDLASAQALAEYDRYQFQWWAVGLVNARPAQDKKKGADSGIDGYIYFEDDDSGKAKQIIVQVKSGKVSVPQVR